jgi:hypothetical protein
MEFLIFLVVCITYPELTIIAAFIYCCLLFGNPSTYQKTNKPNKTSKAENAQLWNGLK